MVKYDIQDHSTFTGKERDEETGYGYFGARYMDYELISRHMLTVHGIL